MIPLNGSVLLSFLFAGCKFDSHDRDFMVHAYSYASTIIQDGSWKDGGPFAIFVKFTQIIGLNQVRKYGSGYKGILRSVQ